MFSMIPIFLIIIWLILLAIRRYAPMLIGSILVVVFSLPYLLTLVGGIIGMGMPGDTELSLAHLLGIGSFLLGVLGIFLSPRFL